MSPCSVGCIKLKICIGVHKAPLPHHPFARIDNEEFNTSSSSFLAEKNENKNKNNPNRYNKVPSASLLRPLIRIILTDTIGFQQLRCLDPQQN
uniref:Uncharacterized protein n=1 Tax=Anguilla anguilla TaxID=7936 RepID=A0A0E9XNR2_ANGAN